MSEIYILLIGELLILLLAYSQSNKDFFSPSVIAIFFFIISTIGIIYNAEYWNVSYSLYTVGIVLVTQIMMLAAEMTVIRGSKKCRKIINDQRPLKIMPIEIKIPIKINLPIVFILGIMAAYYVYDVLRMGSNLGIQGLLSIGATKYSEESLGILSRIASRMIHLLFFVYSYITVNNIVVCKQKLKQNIIYTIPLFCGFVIMFFSGGRKLLVQYPLALIILYVIKRRDISGRKSISTKTLIKKVAPIFLIILSLFYGMREISKASTHLANRSFLDYITYYISSPLYLLNSFFENPQNVVAQPVYFGQYSFLGLYSFLNSIGIISFEVPSNNYLLVSTKAYLAGNEFTWIQRPYSDFGIIGMLIFTFIAFYIFNHVYYKIIICKKPSIKRDFTIIIYSYFYFIVVTSFFITYTISEATIQTLFYVFCLNMFYKFFLKKKKWNRELER